MANEEWARMRQAILRLMKHIEGHDYVFSININGEYIDDWGMLGVSYLKVRCKLDEIFETYDPETYRTYETVWCAGDVEAILTYVESTLHTRFPDGEFDRFKFHNVIMGY